MKALALLLLASTASAADFGPSPYTTNDPAVTVTYVNANTTTGSLNITVNGVDYAGTATWVYDYNIGSVQYYHSLPMVMTTGASSITVEVRASHWVVVVGGRYRYQHYAIQGGTVDL